MEKNTPEQLMLFAQEHHANHLASRDLEPDLTTIGETFRSSFADWSERYTPSGSCGKTSLAYCHQTKDGILVPLSGQWCNSGMGSHTAFSTLNTSEFHSDAAACSLSDILETGVPPQRFFLSATACQGILRRSERRGKKIPQALEQALLLVADKAPIGNIP
jgi:hypothetical protein